MLCAQEQSYSQSGCYERRAAIDADLKARTQHIFDVFNQHDAIAAAAHFTDTAELCDVAVSRPVLGREQIAAIYARHFPAVPTRTCASIGWWPKARL